MTKILLFVLLALFSVSNVFAGDRTVNLVVSYKTVSFAGKPRKAIAVNNQIPAPTLHFKEGDRVTINVQNCLDQDTAIHWHGIIIPWQMDGVEGVNQKGIRPGQVFHYQFTLHQAGTYWYHAHAGLQEQQGLYGAFIIDPPKPSFYKYTKDYVIVLSDWSNTDPNQILSNLKKEGDYYSPRFPLQPSLVKFIHDYKKASPEERKNLTEDYKMMQQMRMSLYDISDVAFDAFLLNGQPRTQPWTAPVEVGDIVRLRFIGAGGSTIFNVKIPGTAMKMVHVQGNDVKPYDIDYFKIAPGETFDVLVKIQENKPYVIYAESIDTLGAAYGALTTYPNQIVNYQVTPFPEPKPVMREMMALMMDHGAMSAGSMNHNRMNMNKPSHSMMSMQIDTHKTHQMKSSPSSSQNISTSKDKSIPNHESMSDSKKMTPNMKMDGMDTNHSMSDMNDSKPMMKSDEKANPSENVDTKNTDSQASNKMNNMPNMSHQKMKIKNDANMNDHISMNHSMKMSDKTTSQIKPKMKMSAHSQHQSMTNNMNHDMKMNHTMAMNHSMHMDMPTEPSVIGDEISPPNSFKKTIGTKYQELIAAVKTNNPNKPVDGVIKMELFGYMDRFIWFINGEPEYKAHPIVLDPNKRYRFIFTNTSMMRHPMHIHGHWFILRNGHGSYDPLLHTLDIPPGATVTADVDTDASGQWFFHCHLLYHMMTGMSRTFQYSTLIEIIRGESKPQNIVKNTEYHNRPIVRVDELRPIDVSLVKHPMAHPIGLWLATFLDVGEDPFNDAQKVTYKGLYGPDYNKLELFTNDAEMNKGKVENADIDIFYWRLISQFWAVKGGVNYFYRPANTPYWQPGVGIEGLMPYFIDTSIRGYVYNGSAKVDAEFSRDTQITNNFFIRTGIRGILATKTVSHAQIGSGLNEMRYILRPYYRLMPGLNIYAEYEHEQAYGVFRNLQINSGESPIGNTVTFGLSVLF